VGLMVTTSAVLGYPLSFHSQSLEGGNGVRKGIGNLTPSVHSHEMRQKTYTPLTLYLRRGSRGISDIPRRPRFTKITNEEHCKRDRWQSHRRLIAVISGVSAINALVAFNDYSWIKGEMQFFYFKNYMI
jgi:hypothetical protein